MTPEERLKEDWREVRGLIFVSDGTRGSDKVMTALKQRGRYFNALNVILETADDQTREAIGRLLHVPE